ncbi:hypothetical protein DTO207G8_4639 [Paecilomyces variotii]|nr:hypothetical protein DTO207G8_4639 [Paecilomyces variotii]KAJ9308651.1 hypothetical protein DTO217A2_1893 [Paecilomyces variotii]KAJ9373156.1 hypothetical protein DTO282E5_2223 [Paecilomyces variotii]
MRAFNWSSFALGIGTINAFTCDPTSLQQYLGSGISVTSAKYLANNATFEVPSSDIGFPTSPTNLPALCALEVKVPSTSNSSYSFGLFLPDDWNGRFLAVGNSGFAGGINWLDMGAGVKYGFATISTDTGHSSTLLDATWAENDPEAFVDWSYRALHGSVLVAKDLTQKYYGKGPAFSYYTGCSTGGRQGLKEAEIFPDDFDGIVAGAPAWWTVHLQLWNMKVGMYNLPTDAPHHIPQELFPIIGAEVLRQCDGSDGVIDNIISDPRRCNFDPETLLCPGTTAGGCLTSPQLDTLYHLYGDWVEANQTFVFPHLELGSEGNWGMLLGSDEPTTLGTDYVKYVLGLGSNWTWQDFNPSVLALSEKLNPGNATPGFDLSAFSKKGGKILHYHGLSDGAIAPGSSLYYYNHVLRTLKPRGIDLDGFYRYFMVPGLEHCTGTSSTMNAPWYFAGANQAGALGTGVSSVPGFADAEHDVLLAMMAWVERGQAPEYIIGTKWNNDTLQDEVARQRPLCMYPKQAMYIGTGDVDDPKNWICEMLYGGNGLRKNN